MKALAAAASEAEGGTNGEQQGCVSVPLSLAACPRSLPLLYVIKRDLYRWCATEFAGISQWFEGLRWMTALTKAENRDGFRERHNQDMNPRILIHIHPPTVSPAPRTLYSVLFASSPSSSSPPFHLFLLHINGKSGRGNARRGYIDQLLCLLTSAVILICWVTQPGLIFPAG